MKCNPNVFVTEGQSYFTVLLEFFMQVSKHMNKGNLVDFIQLNIQKTFNNVISPDS